MPSIIYDVAVSIDGFIAGPGADISQFAHAGPVVEAYSARLAGYAVAIMGAETYRFGYRFGLAPGDNPYPHMTSHVFSQSLDLPDTRAVTLHRGDCAARVRRIAQDAPGPVYCVGGGLFASALLQAGLIDRIRLKRAPILLGAGTPLFAQVPEGLRLRCEQTQTYDDGYLFQDYAVIRAAPS